MQVGGNQSLRSFFEEHGISNDATIREKYSSPAAALYREMYLLACSTPYFQHQSEDPRRRTSDRAPCRLCRLIRRNPARSPSFQIRRRRFGKPSKFPRVFSSLQGFGSTPVTASNDSNAPNSSNSSNFDFGLPENVSKALGEYRRNVEPDGQVRGVAELSGE